MLNPPTDTLPAASIIAIVDDAGVAEPVLRWAQAEAGRLGRDAAVVFAPALDELASASWSGPDLETGARQVQKVIDQLGEHHPGNLRLIGRLDSSLKRLRHELLVLKPRLLVVGPITEPVLAELLFGRYGPGSPPVVLVPPVPPGPARSGRRHRQLTVGFHDTDAAFNALRWAATEADGTDARVRAVVVWSEDQVGRLSGGLVVSSHRCALPGLTAKRMSENALATSGVPLDRVSSVVVRGSPAAVLVREAARSDLLVVGASPTWVHSHPVLGPTAAGCITRTRVPVVVVPAG